jgi:His/Glu/Gln/Arg/opine family amino acid ABC transporter permease subunit
MLSGALITIQIALLSMVGGLVFGIVIMLVRMQGRGVWPWLAQCWIEVARNTPALFQVYMMYFGLGSLGMHLNSYFALTAAIAFNSAGYLAETFRGGLKAIPRTQMQAARSLGMTSLQAFGLIIMPQLLRAVFYSITNQMVWAVLTTALGLTVGLNADLSGVTQQFNVLTYRTFEYFVIAAVLYYLIVKVMLLGAKLLAWRLFRY